MMRNVVNMEDNWEKNFLSVTFATPKYETVYLHDIS